MLTGLSFSKELFFLITYATHTCCKTHPNIYRHIQNRKLTSVNGLKVNHGILKMIFQIVFYGWINVLPFKMELHSIFSYLFFVFFF